MKYLFAVLLAFSIACPAYADITSNLIYHWKFDNDLTEEVAGNSLSAGVGTAAYATSPLPFSGPGTTHCLDVTSDEFTSNSACTGITGPYSIAFWYKRGTSNNNRFTLESGSVEITDTGGLIQFKFASPAYVVNSTTTTSINGPWLHIVATHNGVNRQGAKLYINGVEEADSTGESAVSVPVPNDALTFPGSSKVFKVDDFRIYNRELSASDALELYNYTGATGSPLLLQLQYGQ